MAELMFPFLDVEGDREYTDTDFATFYHNVFTNGVIATVRDKLRVRETAEPGMRVEVLSGAVWIQGRQYLTTEPLLLNVTPGSSTADRVDSIVAQLDMLERKIKILYKQGSTDLRRDENYWEMQLAKINVPRNATAVFNSHIVDTRADLTVCGYSKLQGNLDVEGLEQQYRSLLEQAYNEFGQSAADNEIDLQQLLTDQQSLFQEWFSSLQDELDANQVANLQQQIYMLTPTRQTFTIKHNLGRYPQAHVLYWEYGLGTVPLEGQPSYAPWDGEAPYTIPVKVRHTGRNELDIVVPFAYSMTNPVVKELGNNEFMLQEGIKSMQIRIY